LSYISAKRQQEEVTVWERTDEGRIEKTYRAPYYFYTKDDDGNETSIFGDKLIRHDFRNSKEFNYGRSEFKSSGIEMFESDILPEIRVLSEHYYNKPAPNLNITFLDIEVDYDIKIGFSTIANPYAPINSIAIYHKHQDRTIVYCVPPDDSWTDPSQFDDELHDLAEIVFCKDEKELLLYIIAEIEDSDVICGWNSDFFDMPYIAKRIERVLGKKYFRMLSFPNAGNPKYREVEKFGKIQETIDLQGRVSVDYLNLFQKYEAAERPSYKLEAIADAVLPELPKLHYEGTLHSLYRNDFQHFVRYNIRDTEILKGFEERLGYVALANEMYHISCGLFKHVGGTLKLAELAINNYCHHELNMRVPNVNIPDSSDSIQGAFVLIPRVGLHSLIGSVDINSLYPSAIRSINISPETLIGQFPDNVRAAEEIAKGSMVSLMFEYDDGRTETHNADDWRIVLRKSKWAISGYGTVFDQETKGIIPAILENWYTTRKEYQKLKSQALDAGDKEKAAYYDRLQYVYKIKLNSLYGALNNAYFRFYDLRMGESTTGTGRQILIHQCAKACEILDGTYAVPDLQKHKTPKGEYVDLGSKVTHDGKIHYGYSDKWSVIYGDTDSSYFETHATNEQEAILIADRVGEVISDSFPEYMRETFLCSEGFDDIILTGREIVSDRGIFIDKKRYILHITDNEGEKVDKLKVMGVDTKKTTLPPNVSKKLNSFIERFLKGEEWDGIANDIVNYKDELENAEDVMTIGLPKGVKGVEEYTQNMKVYGENTRLPGHVAASIHYNRCLEEYGDKESMPISSGMKIKVFYLEQKVGRFKSIALPTDIEIVPQWFLNDFSVDKNAHITRLVDKPLGNIIKAIGKDVPSKQSMMVDSLLDF
jgi:DNA polymerase elongation subunit (family B)